MSKSKVKRFSAPGYNMVFNPKNGQMMRWGDTLKDDPLMSPLGPEIADIELTTVCEGPDGVPCSFCYKGNSKKGEHMDLDLFKRVFANLPNTVTQIAFGVDAKGTSNPDMLPIMDYCREQDVVPNVTIANIDDDMADSLARVCGAVAVSRYENKDWCYDSVKLLTDRGMDQVNIHAMISEETYEQVLTTIHDAMTDPRLEKLRAIVLLSLKQKSRGEKFTRLSQEKFNTLVSFAMNNGVSIGFDSCSAPKFANAISDHPKRDQIMPLVEPCESTCFSLYINQRGEYYPCSFTETDRWEKGLDMTVDGFDFMRDIWHHSKTEEFRAKLLGSSEPNGIRHCPLYEI